MDVKVAGYQPARLGELAGPQPLVVWFGVVCVTDFEVFFSTFYVYSATRGGGGGVVQWG